VLQFVCDVVVKDTGKYRGIPVPFHSHLIGLDAQ